jgi:hypothetical protein
LPIVALGALALTLPDAAPAATTPAQCSLSNGAYSGSNGPPERGPVARFRVTPAAPQPAAPASFDAGASSDADGDTIVGYAWNFGDGSPLLFTSSPTTTHTFSGPGTYTVTLGIADCRDSRARTSAAVTVAAGGAAQAGVCRSRRRVRIALPHRRGQRVLGLTISGGGHAARHVGARKLRGRSFSVSVFGYRKQPVKVTIRVRAHKRTRTVRRVLHPCG